MSWMITKPRHENRMVYTYCSGPVFRKGLLKISATSPMVLGPLALGVYRLGHKVEHSLQCSADVKNMWSYTSTSLPILFMMWYLIKHRDNYTFT
jgi:hypothetical protein